MIIGKLVAIVLAVGVVLGLLFGSYYVVGPGTRGILITLGKPSTDVKMEGIGFKWPLASHIVPLSTRQQTNEVMAQAFSSDLQHVGVLVKVLYRTPESSIFNLYVKYEGDVFDSLVAPRVQEALKEVTALETAEGIAKKREVIKEKTLALSKSKIGDLLAIEDIVIEDVRLSKELEGAIEQKMVQEQEAAKARFTQQKAEVEARITIIKAEAEAKAIQIRGDALKDNKGVVDLMLLEKWNGITPSVVAGVNGPGMLLPIRGDK